MQDPMSRASTLRSFPSQSTIPEDPVTCKGSFYNVTGLLMLDSTAPKMESVCHTLVQLTC